MPNFERTMLKGVAVIAKTYKHTDPHTHTHILPYLGHTYKTKFTVIANTVRFAERYVLFFFIHELNNFF